MELANIYVILQQILKDNDNSLFSAAWRDGGQCPSDYAGTDAGRTQ